MTGAPKFAAGDAITELVDSVSESVGCRRAVLFVAGADGVRVLTSRNGRKDDRSRDDGSSSSLARRVVRKRRSFVGPELRTWDPYVTFPPSAELNLKEFSVMAAPLRRGDRILGVLYVDVKAEHKHFTDADLRVVEAAADRLLSLIHI